MKTPGLILAALAALAFSSCEGPQSVYNKGAQFYAARQYSQALPLFTQAANAGSADAKLMLGKCYDFGNGVGKNSGEAIKWYRAAADMGNAEAADNLGSCYFDQRNYAEAVRWYKVAASLNNGSGFNNLGLSYLNGEGVPTNDALAVENFKRAAQLGNANGQYNLGRCYFFGNGVRPDLEQARSWLQAAQKQGHKNAGKFIAEYLR